MTLHYAAVILTDVPGNMFQCEDLEWHHIEGHLLDSRLVPSADQPQPLTEGAFTYDVRSGWGEGIHPKVDEVRAIA